MIHNNEQNYEMFDYKVFSCLEGETKPEPELYKITLNKINIPAKQTLFIDDKYENITTAKSLKMNAIQYTKKESLYHKLKELHILY